MFAELAGNHLCTQHLKVSPVPVLTFMNTNHKFVRRAQQDLIVQGQEIPPEDRKDCQSCGKHHVIQHQQHIQQQQQPQQYNMVWKGEKSESL